MGAICARSRRAALGLLLMTTALCAAAEPAMAQAASAAAERTFNIPAQPLDSALVAFGLQSGLQVGADGMAMRGVRTRGVSGAMPAMQALSLLLEGTGFTYRVEGRAVILAPAPRVEAGAIQLGALRVEGAAGGQSGAGLDAFGRGGDPADRPYETAGASNYISSEQIARFGGETAGDIFKSTPGVISASNHNGASVDVNIRGMQGQNRVRVTIDGTQQSTTTWRGYQGADERVYIDPDLISDVSIAKGPSGGAAGAGVVGGVVEVSTLTVADVVQGDRTWGFRMKGGVSDNAVSAAAPASMAQRRGGATLFDHENGSVSLAGGRRGDRFDIVAAFAYRKTGNYVAGAHGDTTYQVAGNSYNWPLSFTKPGEEVFNTSQETWSALVKGVVRWGDSQALELGYAHYDGKFGETMHSVLFTQDSSFRQVKLTKAATDTYTARYRWNPSELIDLKANVWASRVDAITRSVGPAFYLPPWITPASRPPADDPRLSITNTYGVDASNRSQLETPYGALALRYGGSYLIEDMDGRAYFSRLYASDAPVVMRPSIGTREISSLFSDGEWQAKPWLRLNAALRYDGYRIKEKGQGSIVGSYTDKDGGRLNPSVGATLIPGGGWQVYALYAEGVRPPSLRESIGSDSLLYPNPNLRSEVAHNWELGANYKKDGLLKAKDKARLKLSYFDNRYSDYISRVFTTPDMATNAVFTTANLARARFEGFELSGSYDMGRVFAEWAGAYYSDFSFCRTKATCASLPIGADYAVNQMPPEYTASLTLGARLFKERLTFGTRVNRVGQRLAPITATERMRTGYWLPYTVVDAFATVAVTKALSLDLRGENLGDEYYVDALDGWTPSPGRTLRVSLTARF